MQIKVKDTRIHEVKAHKDTTYEFLKERSYEVLVADAQLILVECKPEKASLYSASDFIAPHYIPPNIQLFKHGNPLEQWLTDVETIIKKIDTYEGNDHGNSN